MRHALPGTARSVLQVTILCSMIHVSLSFSPEAEHPAMQPRLRRFVNLVLHGALGLARCTVCHASSQLSNAIFAAYTVALLGVQTQRQSSNR